MNTAATPDHRPYSDRRFLQHQAPSPRSSFEVDRDRIIHSETFRELQYKTQVQSLTDNSSSTHFRTRLNHVIEVAQVARGIAREIGGNEPLAEAIALGHDLGHPPFGHAGERALRNALNKAGHADWNANVHSLAVVDDVELTYMDFPGLNLTWATREGIARHATPFDDPISFGEFTDVPNSGLEGQIVDAADVLAYLSHDLDDAIAGNYLTLEETADVSPMLGELVEGAHQAWTARGQQRWPTEAGPELRRRRTVANLIARSIDDLATSTSRRLDELEERSAKGIRTEDGRVVVNSPNHQVTIRNLLDLLTRRYYRSEQVQASDARAEHVITFLFDRLLDQPSEVPARFRRHEEALGVANYLISLNDKSAQDLYAELSVVGGRA
ncbi:MAG TPA: HD domain-containing protein [Actinomycetota bacterium]|jgi:dGTPase